MPLAFPSHPGLIAPLWRRFPHRFEAIACGIGAAVPDIVDGALGIARGHLGQWLGHSLLGLFVLDVPVGLALVIATRFFAKRPAAPLSLLVFSTWVGALSHLVFDFISHESFLWLVPFYEPRRPFPEFWYARWFEVRLPGYREPYPIGPHFSVWVVLSVVGAIVFFRKRRR